MNNLLLSLSNQRLKLCASDADLKRLLSSVKDGRNHDAKLADAFYDSLEGVLVDLRAVTIDNRDAEAFLKPVSKTDYPDYYETIANPMDLQTMLKKVKQKHYKSKREFADDLELIWSNCFVYNTGENHPLRLCAQRLREKAERLLKNITDRRERVDPTVPASLSVTSRSPKPNGIAVNGRSHSRHHSITPVPVVKSKSPLVPKQGTPAPAKPPAREVPFLEMPAFVRTASGMAIFAQIDSQLDGPSTSTSVDLAERLRNIAGGEQESEEELEATNGEVGDKRKLLNGSHRPRKRARIQADMQNPVELWWDTTRSQNLMTNAIPTLTYASSMRAKPSGSLGLQKPGTRRQGKRRNDKQKEKPPEQPPTLLALMNDNIHTMKRVRRTHDKFLALNINAEEGGGPSGSIETPEPIGLEEDIDVQVDGRPWRPRGRGLSMGEQEADRCLHWMGSKILEHAGFQGTSKAALDVFTGITAEYLFNVGRTIGFMCEKYLRTMTAEEIILHTLFESGITHIRDLERYIKDDVIRYGGRLVDLEKKLVGAYREVTAVEALDDEALFGNEDEEEDSEFVMGNFADAFGDDFLGLRELGIAGEHGLSTLSVPKKLLKGKDKRLGNTADSVKPTEPPPPYPPPPPFVPLDSRKLDKQIGLLQSFYQQKFRAIAPPSVPFIQPSLYNQPQPYPPLMPPPASQLPPEFQLSAPQLMQPPPAAPLPIALHVLPPILLPDDPPNPARTKIGPLGQIVKPVSGAGSKKKSKAKEPAAVVAGVTGIGILSTGVKPGDCEQSGAEIVAQPLPGEIACATGESPKKKKNPNAGSGAGKKKDKAAGVPPVIAASA